MFVVDQLAGLLDERRLEVVARGRGITKTKASDSVETLFKSYLRRAEEGVLSSLLVEITILHWATRQNAAQVLRNAAALYKVDVEGIALKVKQEFLVKEKARQSKASSATRKQIPPKSGKTA